MLNPRKTFFVQSVTWLKQIYRFTKLLLPLSISSTLNGSKSSLGCTARFSIIAKNVGCGIKICPCSLNNNSFISVCGVTIYKEKFDRDQSCIEKPAKYLRWSILRKQLTAVLRLRSEYAFRDTINKFTLADANLSFTSTKLKVQSRKLKKHW